MPQGEKACLESDCRGGVEQRTADLFAFLKAFLAAGWFQSCVLMCLSFAALAGEAVGQLWSHPRSVQKHFELASGVFPGVQFSGTC